MEFAGGFSASSAKQRSNNSSVGVLGPAASTSTKDTLHLIEDETAAKPSVAVGILPSIHHHGTTSFTGSLRAKMNASSSFLPNYAKSASQMLLNSDDTTVWGDVALESTNHASSAAVPCDHESTMIKRHFCDEPQQQQQLFFVCSERLLTVAAFTSTLFSIIRIILINMFVLCFYFCMLICVLPYPQEINNYAVGEFPVLDNKIRNESAVEFPTDLPDSLQKFADDVQNNILNDLKFDDSESEMPIFNESTSPRNTTAEDPIHTVNDVLNSLKDVIGIIDDTQKIFRKTRLPMFNNSVKFSTKNLEHIMKMINSSASSFFDVKLVLLVTLVAMVGLIFYFSLVKRKVFSVVKHFGWKKSSRRLNIRYSKLNNEDLEDC